MHQFRPPIPDLVPSKPFDLLAIGQLIDGVMQAGHFYVGPDLRLTWIAARAETIAWEIYRRRLLDVAQTREQKTFLAWHVIEENEAHPATEPLISVKLDVHGRRIHVTRGLLCYAWEAYDSADGIESRERIKWTRELVGTIVLEEYADLERLRDELIGLVWQAIVGTSRLPLTSVEAPLPAFVFGQLHYVHHANAGDSAIRSWEDLLQRAFRIDGAWGKVIEFVLRLLTPRELPRFADLLLSAKPHGWAIGEITHCWRKMFYNVSLSPYTCFVENALACIDWFAQKETISAGERIDFLSYLLRQLGRHLTAYDLVTFHHRGANYPDALLLDAVLKRYLQAIESFPDRFLGNEPQARRRRRALRQGCLMRRHYEGHRVPDLPTSPGENARVMPASHPRVPEEQILHPQRRRRQLFTDDPLLGLMTEVGCLVLAQSVLDLEHLEERAELGVGVFIDRPLGYAKAPAEPDLTPLLAHEAFSPSIARRRWQELSRLCEDLGVPVDRPTLQPFFDEGPWPTGLPHAELAECPRPTAALTDVRKVADDFVILRTKPMGLGAMLFPFQFIKPLWERYRLQALHEVSGLRLCVQVLNEAKQPTLVLYDERLRRRVEILVDASEGYVTRAGIEYPKAGLRVVAVWEDTEDGDVLVRREV